MAKKKVETPRLVAKQIIPVQMPDGQTSLAIIAQDGVVYTYVGTGWSKLIMMEAPDDPKV